MKFIKNILPVLFLCFMSFMILYAGSDKNGNSKLSKTNLKAGDAYRMSINNLILPLDKQGVIADVSIGGSQFGLIDGNTFLYSGGFFLSGKTNGKTWVNSVASASRIQDYVPGTIAGGRNDSRAQLYVLKYTDGDFSESWQEWKDAVALGANFYDGNGDGIYNPVDLNGNGKWDLTEDRPDLIGDETVWCVYNDGVEPSLRTFNDVEPQKIEIRQSVFGFNSKDVVGNMLFVRYSILNTGMLADVMDSVYFGVWADPDLGDPLDDLVGCDTLLNAGFVYANKPDEKFGINSPCFLVDFFQGPVSYIPGKTFTDNNGNGMYDEGTDVPVTTAYNVQGQVRGLKKIPGAINLGLSSFVHYMQGNPTLGDPANRMEARNYILGRDKKGSKLDPCTWPFGSVKGGVSCTDVDNKFWYSGDPVRNIGWINNTPVDQRQMLNTGPFKLEKGKPIDIVVAYIVGRGKDALASVDVAKEYSRVAQILFDNNFPSPPPPQPVKPVITTGDGFIDLTWDTDKQVSYHIEDTILNINRKFQGFYVSAYRTNSKLSSIGGIENIKEIARYELDNNIKGLYVKAANGGKDLIFEEAADQFKLDSLLYVTPGSGRINLRIDKDPFTGNSLIKGKEYYFTITQCTINHKFIVNNETGRYGGKGDYYDPTGNALQQYESQPISPVIYGKDLYSPAIDNKHVDRMTGKNNGEVQYLVVDKSKLTGDNYSVEFFKDEKSQGPYSPFWKLTNTTKGKIVLDSSKVYDYDTTKYAGIPTDGFILKVKPCNPKFGTPVYYPLKNTWFKNFSGDRTTGVYYIGKDITGTQNVIGTNRSNAITADQLKQVELRFGDHGKAYRYLNGFVGNPITRRSSFVYAAGVTAGDTANGGVVGKLGEGFVDVPFTAWVRDSVLGIQQQLAVGFIETASKKAYGKPDGIWNPADSIQGTLEYILIFNSPYDPSGKQVVYTGGTFNTASGEQNVWADVIKGYSIPADAPNITDEQRTIAASPYFNTLYIVGLEKQTSNPFAPGSFTPGDRLVIPVETYAYTNLDKFSFATRPEGELNSNEKKTIFEKVNVFPNPLFAYNPSSNTNGGRPDEPFVTFSNLPAEVTIKIYTLSGTLIRTLGTKDKSAPSSPFLKWNLENESQLRVASGFYLAIVSAPGFGEKVLKFSIIMPQKQIQKF